MGQRKIALVVNKLNYREAEDADDKFWANATESERLYTLMDLRIMVFGLEELGSIEKVVYKKKIHEEA